MFGTDLRVIGTTDSGSVVACPGLFFGHFWGRTEDEEVAYVAAALDIAAQHPQGIAVLVVVDEDADAPDRRRREAIAAAFTHHVVRLVGWAGCVRGSGLAATSKRTIMRLIMSLGNMRCPWTVVNTPDKATAWLAGRVEEGLAEPTNAALWAAILGRTIAERSSRARAAAR